MVRICIGQFRSEEGTKVLHLAATDVTLEKIRTEYVTPS